MWNIFFQFLEKNVRYSFAFSVISGDVKDSPPPSSRDYATDDLVKSESDPLTAGAGAGGTGNAGSTANSAVDNQRSPASAAAAAASDLSSEAALQQHYQMQHTQNRATSYGAADKFEQSVQSSPAGAGTEYSSYGHHYGGQQGAYYGNGTGKILQNMSKTSDLTHISGFLPAAQRLSLIEVWVQATFAF